jgi:hypothetical protein
MRIAEITKGRTFKRVIIYEVHPSTTDLELHHFALVAANETTERIFDFKVERLGSSAVVTLYTD